MKRKSHGGSKPPFLTTHVHLNDDTALSVDVVMEETPLLNIGNDGHEVTLFFTKETLDRTVEALRDLQRGSALLGLTWNAYVDTTTPGTDACPVHGATCRKVWHKNVAPVG